jgi:uncharacterized protein GlcG (DUF336 family)
MKAVPSFKLTQEGTDIIVNAAIEKAKELKQIVSIAVVDAGGHLFAFKRMTNGRTHNTHLALAKARGAALTTAATGKTNREGAEIPDHQVLAQTLGVGPGGSSVSRGAFRLRLKASASARLVSAAPRQRWIVRSGRPESTRLAKRR